MQTKQAKPILKRLQEMVTRPKQLVSEMIGRISYQINNHLYNIRPTIDYTQVDYEWFDKLRRGKQSGFEIGGLFAAPIAEIISSWTLGDGFTVEFEQENEATETALAEFLQDYLETLVESNEDKLTLGDAYIIVNADGSLQKISPEQIEIKRDELDFTRIVAITVKTINEGIEIEDIYTDSERLIRIRRGGEIAEQSFPNLIGRIPIIHFAHDRSPNEAFGHPYFESLLTLFAEYDDVIRKGLDGVKIMGNPFPVVEGLEDAESAKRTNSSYTETYVDKQGNTQTDYRIEMSPSQIMWLGKGASMKLLSPNDFTGNTTDMLKKLFYIMLQVSKIPEWVWGGAISSSMASVEAQAPAFAKFISGQRRKLESDLRALIEIYLATISLFTPAIASEGRFSIQWPEIMPVDKELVLKWAMWLKENGAITKETALRLADVVQDVSLEIQNAQTEQKAEQAQSARREMANQALQFRNGTAQGTNQGNAAQNQAQSGQRTA